MQGIARFIRCQAANQTIWLVAFIVVAWLLTVFFLRDNWKEKEGQIFTQDAVALSSAYRASVEAYRLMSATLTDEVVRTPQVIDIFARGVHGDAGARRDLHHRLAGTYDHLKRQGILQFQFHTTAAASYLRFHAPDKFGDPLAAVRHTVRIANAERRAVFGFESGRVVSGFRYVYPLFQGKEHLGSVEISVTFESLRDAMDRVEPTRHYAFVLRRDQVDQALFAEQRHRYRAAPIDARFLIEDPQAAPADASPAASAVSAIDALLAAQAGVGERMAAGASFGQAVSYRGGDWLASFLPVANVLGENAGYVISYSPAPGVGALRREFLFGLAFVTLAFGLLAWAGLRLMRSRAALARDKEQLRKLAQAIEQSQECIIITGLDARIEYVNAACTRISGYAADELLGQNPRIQQSGKTPPETYAALWAALSRGLPWRGELINRRKDGSEYVELALITPLQQDGHITHYVAVKEDITERRRMSAELDRHRHHLEELVAERTTQLAEARDAAETANRAKSAFLANMSHEIRTPLNAILGLTHLLRGAAPTPAQVERLGKIDSAGRHLLSIISNILDLSKIEAGKLQLEQRDFALSAVLDHVRSMILNAAQDKGLGVTVAGDHVPLWLCGDPTRLRQALLNYAANAVKFTSQGNISLRARLLEDSGAGLLVRFEVQDSGIGIAAADKERLFDAFEQVDATTTRKYGGTGLGLPITRRLVQLMGGETGVDSTPGVGSTFWFTVRLQRGHGIMPADPATETAADDAETQLRRHYGGTRLLLAEDNPINREVALELLHGVGLAVDTAQDGREALAMAQRHAYALVLMDVQMPHMDGLDATRAIRALPHWQHTPILAMTANAFEENRRACAAAGMDDFVTKPVEPGAMYAALYKWLPRPATDAVPPAPTFGAGRTPDDAPATAPAGAELQQLSVVPGIDLKRGLAMVRGNATKYVRLLTQFAHAHDQDAANLASGLAAGDLEGVMRLAHTLKGSAGNLGATAVQDSATVLYTAIARESGRDEIKRLLTILGTELSALIGAIHLLPTEPAPPAALASGQLAAVLDELAALLAIGDMAAGDLARESEPLLRAGLGAAATAELRTRINAFDYEAALAVLNKSR